MPKNTPTYIVVHCSDSTWGDAAEIDRWHRARGFARIGYHAVILNSRRAANGFDLAADGRVELGREETAEGAHAPGFNSRSLGICLIGSGSYTDAQMTTLHALLEAKCRAYGIPAACVLGHGETDSGKAQGKTCPLLDMPTLRAELERRLTHQPGRAPDESCTRR